MGKDKYRILCVCTHPVQYASPVFRLMAGHPKLDMHVVYCSLQGAESAIDEEFGREVKWDVPLLDGYAWVHVRNYSLNPKLGHFWGLCNLGLWRMVRNGNFDAVLLYTGYRYASFWLALLATRLSRTAVLFGTDAGSINPREGSWWKLLFKPFVLSHIYKLADGVWATSLAGKEYLQRLGVPEDHLGVVPLVVDNDWWTDRAAEVDRRALRKSWGIPEDAPVVLFCAKLQPWKRPLDLLHAFAKAEVPNAHLVFAGTGHLENQLKAESRRYGVANQVHFLGFQNQTRLPGVYRSADLFVLPSEYDPCPAVVCEAMLCGLPVILSDQIRGRFELVRPGKTGFIYPCGDIDKLASLLRENLVSCERLANMGSMARQMMKDFSPQTNLNNHIELLDRTFQRRDAVATS